MKILQVNQWRKLWGIRHVRAIRQAVSDVNWYRYAQRVGVPIYADAVERDKRRVKAIWDGRD